MMHDRNDDKDAAADDQPEDQETSQTEDAKGESNSDETDGDGTKRFERSDNLRRRSEWFQKRTGGR